MHTVMALQFRVRQTAVPGRFEAGLFYQGVSKPGAASVQSHWRLRHLLLTVLSTAGKWARRLQTGFVMLGRGRRVGRGWGRGHLPSPASPASLFLPPPPLAPKNSPGIPLLQAPLDTHVHKKNVKCK